MKNSTFLTIKALYLAEDLRNVKIKLIKRRELHYGRFKKTKGSAGKRSAS